MKYCMPLCGSKKREGSKINLCTKVGEALPTTVYYCDQRHRRRPGGRGSGAGVWSLSLGQTVSVAAHS
jgi:hypothetical protein